MASLAEFTLVMMMVTVTMLTIIMIVTDTIYEHCSVLSYITYFSEQLYDDGAIHSHTLQIMKRTWGD